MTTERASECGRTSDESAQMHRQLAVTFPFLSSHLAFDVCTCLLEDGVPRFDVAQEVHLDLVGLGGLVHRLGEQGRQQAV